MQALWQTIQGLSPQWQRDLLLDAIPALVRKYGNVAATAAAEWYERTRATQVDGPYEPVSADLFPDAAIQATIRYKAGDLFNGGSADMAAFLNGALNRWVQYSGRETIARNIRRDPSKPRFARVPTGAKTCAFCEMLASRGFVYLSEQSAKATKLLRAYHNHCDCQAVAEWDRDTHHIEGYDPDAMYSRYLQARAAAEHETDGTAPSTTSILAHMRRMHPESYTDGIGVKRPSKPPQPTKKRAAYDIEKRILSMRGEPRLPNKAWDERQTALGIPISTDALEMHEIVFLERFRALGNHYEWIPKDMKSHEPTNDFTWAELGADAELKSMTSMKYRSIAQRINDSVTKASQQGVSKENFIIDLGQETIPDKLVRRLALYNRVHESTIKSLFVLDANGLNRIELSEK